MRIVALLLGLAAGLFALVAPIVLRTDLMTPFMALWSGSANHELVGRLIWYGVPAAAVVGGIVATFAPGFAMLLLATAALGWVGMGLAMPEAFDYRLMAPAAAAGLAAVLALVAAEMDIRRRRVARRRRRALTDVDDHADEIEREAALRMDPVAIRRDQATQQPRRVVELDLDDVAPVQKPAGPPPRWQDLDAEPVQRQRPDIWGEAIRPEREKPPVIEAIVENEAEPEPEPEPEEPPSPAQRGFRWDRADAPVGQRFGQASPGPTIVQVRRAPAPQPPPASTVVERPAPMEAPRAASVREAAPLWPEPELQQARQTEDPRPVARRGGGLVPALLAVFTVLLLGVLAAGGYFAYRDGWIDRVAALMAPPAVAPTGTAATPEPAPVATAAAEPEASSSELVLPPEPELASTQAPPATEPATLAVLPSSPSSPPPAEAVETYADPFAYCSAVGTMDYVDRRYTGPMTTAAIAEAVSVPDGAARDRVRWRCFDGSVVACTSYIGPICDVTPSVEEMQAYCAQYPNAPQLMAPGGVWSCSNGKPQLPPDASWPVDARGFRSDSWFVVKQPATPAG